MLKSGNTKNTSMEVHIKMDTESRIERWLGMIFLAIKVAVHTFIFPGIDSARIFGVCGLVFVLSGISAILGVPSLKDWRGALAGTIIAGIMYLIERRRK